MICADTSQISMLAQKFAQADQETRDKMLRASRAIAIDLQSYIRTNKLQGQVLHQRSGRLSRGVRYEVEAVGPVIKAEVGVFEGVPYAAIHEYGGEIMRTGRIKGAYVIHMPERSYVRSSLREKVGDYAPRLARAAAFNKPSED